MVAKHTKAFTSAGLAAFALISLISYGIWSVVGPVTTEDRLLCVQAITQLVGGAALLAGLGFTWANLKIAQASAASSHLVSQQSLQLQHEGHITDRFAKAIELIGSERLEVRLGGIYSLERIARDSERDYWPVMEVLTAFVRERSRWADENEIEAAATPQVAQVPHVKSILEHWSPIAPDIQAVLTVLGRRHVVFEKERQRLDLRASDLRGASLAGACLVRTQFQNAHLDGANCSKSDCRGANFANAKLQHTDFIGADLRMTHFVATVCANSLFADADFAGATMDSAIFDGADLRGVRKIDPVTFCQARSAVDAYLDEWLRDIVKTQCPSLLYGDVGAR